MDARVELPGGNVLRRDGAGIVPIAGEGIGQSEVLANRRVGVGVASRRLEHLDCLGRMPGERQREAVIGFAKRRTGFLERRNRLVPLAQRGLNQGELQHHLRLLRVEAERVLVGGFGRAEPAAGEISIAEQRAEAGVGRRLGHRLLGELDRLRHLVGIERLGGASGEADIANLAAQARLGLGRGAAGQD